MTLFELFIYFRNWRLQTKHLTLLTDKKAQGSAIFYTYINS